MAILAMFLSISAWARCPCYDLFHVGNLGCVVADYVTIPFSHRLFGQFLEAFAISRRQLGPIALTLGRVVNLALGIGPGGRTRHGCAGLGAARRILRNALGLAGLV